MFGFHNTDVKCWPAWLESHTSHSDTGQCGPGHIFYIWKIYILWGLGHSDVKSIISRNLKVICSNAYLITFNYWFELTRKMHFYCFVLIPNNLHLCVTVDFLDATYIHIHCSSSCTLCLRGKVTAHTTWPPHSSALLSWEGRCRWSRPRWSSTSHHLDKGSSKDLTQRGVHLT